MTNDTEEPSAASAGSLVCPYVTGTVTRYCMLTPFTLTDAEREALLTVRDIYAASGDDSCVRIDDAIDGLLERTGGGR